MMTRQRILELLSFALFIVLLLFGTFSAVMFYGESGHASVLISDSWKQTVTAVCPSLDPLCTAWHGMGPAIVYAFQRMQPLQGYLLWSILLFGIFLGWRIVTSGDPFRRLRVAPWHVLGLFVLAVWIFFNVIAFGSIASDNGNGTYSYTPVAEIIQPDASTYAGDSERALQALQENFQSLRDRGCLDPTGEATRSGAPVYRISGVCLEGAFFTRVLPPLLVLFLVLLNFFALGGSLLRLLRVHARSVAVDALMSVALGACAMIVALWVLAVAGLYTSVVGWVLLLLIPAACYRECLTLWHRLRHAHWTSNGEVWGIGVLLAWLLVSYLAFNFLHLIRPFPLGWDDLGSYMNRPNLLVSYGHAIPSMSTFQWEYITSIGFLLFGFGSSVGASVSMLINWMAGALAVFSIIVFVRTFLGRGGVLTALLYYTLPLVGHFSFADMKIDNAIFFFGVSGLLGVFLYLFPHAEEEEGANDRRWLIVAGIFFAFAISTKVTAAMPLIAAMTVLIGAQLGVWAAVGASILSIIVYLAQGALPLADIANRIAPGSTVSAALVAVVALVAGGACIAYAAWKNRASVRPAAVSVGVLALTLAVCIAPWLLRNNILHGNTIPRLEFGAPNIYSPIYDIGYPSITKEPGRQVIALPKDLKVDTTSPMCKGSGGAEELDRYWGNGTGWGHYLTLPWRTAMNADSNGYYVITSFALLLFPLLLLLPYFWLRQARWLRWLFVGTALMVVQWVFLANGVPWYGIGMLLGLCVACEVFVARAPDMPNKILVSVFLFLALLANFSFRMWQFEQQRFLFEYTIGKVTDDVLRQRTILHYDDVSAMISERRASMPKRPYTYRMGTFMPFFVPQNLEAFPFSDNQLDFFNCISFDNDPKKTLARLQALGFNGMVFDTNTHTIEKDANGSLHQKVAKFVDFVSNHPDLGIKTVVADPDAGIAYFLLP